MYIKISLRPPNPVSISLNKNRILYYFLLVSIISPSNRNLQPYWFKPKNQTICPKININFTILQKSIQGITPISMKPLIFLFPFCIIYHIWTKPHKLESILKQDTYTCHLPYKKKPLVNDVENNSPPTLFALFPHINPPCNLSTKS